MITTKQDLINRLQDILALEKIAFERYKEDAEKFHDVKIIKVIEKIKDDEKNHIKMLEHLLNYLVAHD